MADAESVVRAFFEDTNKPGNLIGALETHCADGCVWENTGLPTANGLEEMKGFFQQFIDGYGMNQLRVEYKGIAADGGKVLTERVDIFVDGDGKDIMALDVSGTLEVEGDKIVAWRDYFDPRPFIPEG